MFASRLAVFVTATVCLASLCSGGEGFVLRDDFAAYAAGSDGAPAWETTGILWETAGGKYVAADAGRSFAIAAKAPHARRVVVEATATVRKAVGSQWKIAGVAIVLDERNYWHFAFVEGPDDERERKRHFVELSEMLDGVWLSHSNAETRLTVAESTGDALDWQYGRPYRIRIELTEADISGTLSEMDGKVLARKRYKLDNKAVTSGRPALTCGGLVTAFDDAAIRCEKPVPAPEPETLTFPGYTQAGRVPPPDEPRGKATGFFHVEQHDGRWWAIDPKGRPFFFVGTDHVRYGGHWCEKLGYAPYGRNMREQFGSEEKWAADTAERLLRWGFNCVGAGHSPSMRHRGLAWMGFISFGAMFSDVSDLCPKTTWTGFPNVFHPKWPLWCDKRAKQMAERYQADPWLVGWFLDNELEWYGKEHREWSLIDEILKKPADHSGKQALLNWLRRRYPTVDALNGAWGTEAASYDAIAASTEPLRHATERGRADKLAFLAVIAERYFATAAAAVRKHDPNHMILGSRFAGGFPEGIGAVAGRHCDIFTINCYRRINLETEVIHGFAADLARWHAEVKRPFMITEWSFPALDSGLPCKHGAGMRVDTQAQKAKCFTLFQRHLFATPYMVGSNYFMWADEPALGISSTFPEDSNYGLVDEHNKPYKELTEAATRLNPQACAYHADRLRVPEPAAPRRASGPLEPPAVPPGAAPEGPVRLARTATGWRVDAGRLALVKERSGGNAFDRVVLDGTEIGSFVPVIWQDVGQNLWPQPDAAKIAAAREEKTRLVLDIEFELRPASSQKVLTAVDDAGKLAAQARRPGALKACYRFFVYPGRPWFGARCLWVENADTRPWKLMACFHYAVPKIAGNASDDEVGGPDVPNYYMRDAAVTWFDPGAKLHYGIAQARSDDFELHFWKDPGGGFHADVRREIGVTLKPGERYAEPQPTAYVFGASGERGSRAWMPIVNELRAMRAVK